MVQIPSPQPTQKAPKRVPFFALVMGTRSALHNLRVMPTSVARWVSEAKRCRWHVFASGVRNADWREAEHKRPTRTPRALLVANLLRKVCTCSSRWSELLVATPPTQQRRKRKGTRRLARAFSLGS